MCRVTLARRSAAWMQRVASGPGMALLATPGESEERRTNRQDSRFACIAPVGRGTGMCRVIQAAIGSPADSRLPGSRTSCAFGVPIRSQRIGLWLLFFRLHGCRRYDPKDGGGRIASGTAIESNAGAVAEAKQKKVTRLRGRDPDSNNRRVSDTVKPIQLTA
jgi:hypothetical protein